MPELLQLFLIPFATLLLVMTVPLSGRALKRFALALSLLPLVFLLYHYYQILGWQISYNWFPQLGIRFELAVDPLALLFLLLTAIVIPISFLAARSLSHAHLFYALAFLLEGLLFGFFTARDLALFTFFWEAMLIPLYFMMALWGGPQRGVAALKFIIYMLAGSALMVAAVLALYFSTGSFALSSLSHFSGPNAPLIFAIFMLAFAVKIPLFPFHGWLPDAYYQASTAGTILLSAILSKAGIYGIARIGGDIFPELLRHWSPLLLGLAVAGVFYGGLAAWRQNDYKRLIAYSSLSHVNFILVGLFIAASPAFPGALLQSFNHGITIAALFLVAGWLEERLGSTQMGTVSGLCKFMPHLCWLTLFFVLSAVALPGTNNFVGELMILLGLFKEQPWLTAFLTLSVILSVIYMLRWMQKVYFEAPTFYQERWVDIRCKEILLAFPLIFLILSLGMYPAPLLSLIDKIKEAP